MRTLEVRNRRLRSPVTGAGDAVVCMTTYGSRAERAHLALESIARGRLRPRRLILWIDEEALLADLPRAIRRLQARGLEVLRCPAYGPHNKQYPYASSLPTHVLPLVTADDDTLYPRGWLAGLVTAHRQTPDVVVGYRAHTIALDGGGLASYAGWSPRAGTAASYRVLCTGCSGTIYPPRLVEAFGAAGTEFLKNCPRADDIWVHAVAVRNGFMSRQLGASQVHFHLIPETQVGTLQRENVREGGNDRQIAATYGPAEVASIIGGPA